MMFRQLFDPETSTYTYVLGDELTKLGIVIDPVRERSADVLAVLAETGLKLVYSLETHIHADHVSAGAMLRERTACQLAMHGLATDCGCADVMLAGGDELTVGALRLRVLETPGHTPDSISLLVNDALVFTGDALLIGTCGRTDFQGGDAGQLYDSIHRTLFALADEVIVYPGHDYKGNTASTIGAERRENTRAVGRTRDEFIALMGSLNLPPPRRLAEAVPANRLCGHDPHAV